MRRRCAAPSSGRCSTCGRTSCPTARSWCCPAETSWCLWPRSSACSRRSHPLTCSTTTITAMPSSSRTLRGRRAWWTAWLAWQPRLRAPRRRLMRPKSTTQASGCLRDSTWPTPLCRIRTTRSCATAACCAAMRALTRRRATRRSGSSRRSWRAPPTRPPRRDRRRRCCRAPGATSALSAWCHFHPRRWCSCRLALQVGRWEGGGVCTARCQAAVRWC
mmetsp:Transcript_38641/g.114793  ORF Transcript_38641/g.114793 Transcript_38641/m.114793 type:complete len:218 (-) Transcript_38641:296-949(-)